MSLCLFVFFFSSRRRHTRLQGDWSSDVCSSDLGYVCQRLGVHHERNSPRRTRSEEHTSELQSPCNLVCRLLLEKKKEKITNSGIVRNTTVKITIHGSSYAW